jgi:dTDP-4-dehydrorhamnose reductase
LPASPRILVIGGTGQVGRAVISALAPRGVVIAPSRTELDLLDHDSIRRVIRAVEPDVIINAAAYTAVDRGEDEPELAWRVNVDATQVLAREARDSLLVQFSSDYVFDGSKGTPYVETDAPSPVNVYGRTKLESEIAVASECESYLLLRTSWVYSTHGQNFPRTVLRRAHEGRELRIVNDQVGAPTSAAAIAEAVSQILAHPSVREAPGVYHVTAAGSTTWYDFARTILGESASIQPVSSAEYGARARRPLNSVLDNSKVERQFGVRLAHWRDIWRSSRA